MARRPRVFAPGLLYHVIVRGNQQQKTFLTAQDYAAYLERVSRYRDKYDVTVYAYCLMPNHVHQYSGHRAYPSGSGTGVVKPSPVLALLGGRRGYLAFVRNGREEGHKEEFCRVEDQRFLGREGFGEKVRRRAEERSATRTEKPLGTVFNEVARELQVEPEVLRGPERAWAVCRKRALVAFMLVRRFGYRLGAVAEYLHRDAATVSALLFRLAGAATL